MAGSVRQQKVPRLRPGYTTMKKLVLVIAVAMISFISACGVVDRLRGRDDDDNTLWLLALVASTLNSGSCQNQSGLVICIPPGFRQ
jgi:hypothetical protein